MRKDKKLSEPSEENPLANYQMQLEKEKEKGKKRNEA